MKKVYFYFFFFFQAEDGIRDLTVTGVQTCALPISGGGERQVAGPGMGGPAAADELEALRRLEGGARGVLGGEGDVHRLPHGAGGVDAGAAGLVGGADEVRV